jgi:hypothetical protein
MIYSHVRCELETVTARDKPLHKNPFERDQYDINDPRTREHEAYKIAQRNGAAAARRFWYGDDVDADGTNYDPDEADNEDSQEQRLENAREARAWAFE